MGYLNSEFLQNCALNEFFKIFKVKNGKVTNSKKLRKEGLATRLARQFEPPIAYLIQQITKQPKLATCFLTVQQFYWTYPFPFLSHTIIAILKV